MSNASRTPDLQARSPASLSPSLVEEEHQREPGWTSHWAEVLGGEVDVGQDQVVDIVVIQRHGGDTRRTEAPLRPSYLWAGQERIARVPDGRVAFDAKVTRGWDRGSQRFTRGTLNAAPLTNLQTTQHLSHTKIHSTRTRRVSAEVSGTSQNQASAIAFHAHPEH